MVAFGCVWVLACVLGGYAAMGGKMGVLNQPFEVVIIGGAAVGAYIIGNPKSIISKTGPAFGKVFAGTQLTKQHYLDLFAMLFKLFKLIKTKGLLAIEPHIEDPKASDIFSENASFMKDHHAVDFVCDYLRLVSMGIEDPGAIEGLMNNELKIHHQEQHALSHALTHLADGMPALGIVAAVLGVIKTMGKIDSPPSVLGKYIGGALVGTFLGILWAYGFFGPFATQLVAVHETESVYFEVLKVAIVAHLKGHPPAVSLEFARKVITSDLRPSFAEVEESLA